MKKPVQKLLDSLKLKLVEVLTKEKRKTNLALIVKDNKEKRFFFKVTQYKDKSDAQTLTNEILFYTKIAPLLDGQALIPQIYSYSFKEPAFYLSELIKGQPLGEAYELKLKNLRAAYFEPLIDFIFELQDLSPAQLKKDFPDFIFKKGDASFETYHARFKERKADLIKILSLETILEMERLLLEKKNFLKEAPEVFSNQDLNAGNVILDNKDDLKMVDCDTLRIIANPASVFSFLYTAFWPQPQLQREFGKLIVDKGEERYQSFSEYFRLDFLFFRGLGVLWRYYQETKPALLLKALRDAVLRKGIWR